jgi:tetratricopeptide (TPR) repeat protein
LKTGDIWLQIESADSDVALREIERARKLLIEAGDRRSLVFATELIGWAAWWQGDLSRAREAMLEMRRMTQDLGWISREADAVMQLLSIAAHRGDMSERAKLRDEVQELAARSGSRLTRARAQLSTGIYLAATGQTEEGLNELLAAGTILEEFGDRDEAYTAFQWLGDVSRRLGRFDEAMTFYERAKTLVAEHAGFLPEVHRRMAQVHLARGDVAAAAENAELAYRITGRDDWATVASTRMVLGRVREAQGQYEDAERLLLEAADVNSRIDFNSWEEDLALAEFYFRRGRRDEAEKWATKARNAVTRYGPESPLHGYVASQIAAAEAAAPAR